MTGDRMRRVDEAVREVLSDAITHELKDPRVGFVTVTAVETSPDLRHARVFVSVLGDEPACAGARWTGCVRARLPAAARSRASCGSSTRRRSSSSTTTPSTAALRIAELLERGGGRSERARTAPRPSREQVLDELRDARRASCCTTHEHPDGDALGSLAAMQLVLGRARQGRRRLHGRRTSSRCPTSTASSSSTQLVTEPPADLERAHDRVPGLRQHRPQPGRRAQARRRAHPQHRPPPRQHALRDGQPRRAATRRARPRWSGT